MKQLSQISLLTRTNPVAITVNGKEDTVVLSHEDYMDQIIMTDSAKQDLRDISLYIYQNTKEKNIVKKFLNELWNQCTILKDDPTIGTIPKDRVLRNLEYRYIVHKGYLLFYKVNKINKNVSIQSIVNKKRNRNMCGITVL